MLVLVIAGMRTPELMINFVFDEVMKVVKERVHRMDHPNDDRHVITLNEKDFDQKVMKSHDLWFIDFFAPWCWHCKKMESDWNHLAFGLKDKMKIAKVDATVERNLVNRLAVRTFPTLKLFVPRENKTEDYAGERDHDSLMKWALQRIEHYRPTIPCEQLVNLEVYKLLCLNSGGKSCVFPVFLNTGIA
jgi:protein disulfide-isomerase A6